MEKNLTMLFKPFLEDPAFQEVLGLVKDNSRGKIWIIGGFVYKNLASALYGGNFYDYDIDFIVEHKQKTLKEVAGWDIELNSYLNPNYAKENRKMSFTDIHNAIRISGMKEPTIEAFIDDTPLTIQSIAYDISECKLIGEKGISALLEKSVAINNKAQAEFYAQRKRKTLEQVVLEKISELNF